MADPWKAPEGEEIVPALVPRQLDRYALQSSLADLAHTDKDSASEPTALKPATPGTAGHQALAALAAEVAEQAAAAVGSSAGGDTSPGPTGEVDQGHVPAAAPAVTPLTPPPADPANPQAGLPRARPRPFGGPPTDRPAPTVPAPSDAPVALVAPGTTPKALVAPGTSPGLRPPARLRTGADDRPASPPAMTVPGAVRLTPAAPRPPSVLDAEQSTIPLRRRPVAAGPASIAPDPTPRGETADPAPAARAAVVLEAWSPGEDDILPDRQVRRRRTLRRGR